MKWFLISVTMLLTVVANGQYIEFSFPSPSTDISGLAFKYNTLYVLDSLDRVLIELNPYSGTIMDTIQLPPTENPPVGLTAWEDTLWFAEGGTGIVHMIDKQGNEIDVFDLSDSGPQSITGLAHSLYDDEMLLMDGFDKTIYNWHLQNGYVEEIFQLQGCPEVHDISDWLDGMYIGVACNDSLSPVRLYYSETAYDPLDFGEFESAVGVASWGQSRFYFSDPSMGLIHRYCVNMGAVEEGTSGLSPVELQLLRNPSPGYLEYLLSGFSGASPEMFLYDITGRICRTVPEGTYGEEYLILRFDNLPPGVYCLVCPAMKMESKGLVTGN